MNNAFQWDFLRMDPVEKTIVVDPQALVAPLREFGRGLGRDGRPALVEYAGEIDLFEDKVPEDAICQAIAVMIACPLARFMVATVQPAGAAGFLDFLRPKLPTIEGHVEAIGVQVGLPGCFTIRADLVQIPNLALGVAVSDQATADDRVGLLLSVPAAFHFAAQAPAAGAIDWTKLAAASGLHRSLGYTLDALRGRLNRQDGAKVTAAAGKLDWIFASGEGRGFRNVVHPDWIRSTARQCDAARVPFAFGAWGVMVPGTVVSIEADAPIAAPVVDSDAFQPLSRGLAGAPAEGEFEAGFVDMAGHDAEAAEELRAYHAARRGKIVLGIGADGKPASIAIAADPADASFEMVRMEEAEDAVPAKIDGQVRFDVPAFLTGDEGVI